MNKEQCVSILNSFYNKEENVLKIPTMIFIGSLKLYFEKAIGYAIHNRYITLLERSKTDLGIKYEIYEVLEDDIFTEIEKEKVENQFEKYQNCKNDKEIVDLIDKDVKVLLEKIDILKNNLN